MGAFRHRRRPYTIFHVGQHSQEQSHLKTRHSSTSDLSLPYIKQYRAGYSLANHLFRAYRVDVSLLLLLISDANLPLGRKFT